MKKSQNKAGETKANDNNNNNNGNSSGQLGLFWSSPVLQLRMRACNLQLPMPLSPPSPSLSLSALWGDTCQSHSSIFSR